MEHVDISGWPLNPFYKVMKKLFPVFFWMHPFHGMSLTAFIMSINPKMDMQKIVTLVGFGVRVDPGEYFVKKRNFK